MKREYLWLAMITAFVLLTAGPLSAKTLYDDFTEDYVTKVLWRDNGLNTPNVNEFVREIKNGALVLKVGSHEYTDPLRNNLRFMDPAPISAMSAEFKVVEINNDPTDSGTAYARMGGFFYNRDAASPSDMAGDVWAEICIGDRGSGLEAWYEIEIQTGTTDDTWIVFAMDTLATGLALNTAYTLSLDYDGDDGFAFQISGSGVTPPVRNISGPAYAGPCFTTFKALTAALHEDFDEHLNAYVHAEIDNVHINGQATAYESFDATRIDMAKWRDPETVHEAVDGRLRLNQRYRGSTFRNRATLLDRYTDYLEATLRIESGSQVSSGARGRLRLRGYFYAEDDTYGDYDGEVWVQIGLALDEAGALTAYAVAETSDANEINYVDRFREDFPTAIQFDTDYVLSIALDRTAGTLEFKCNTNTLTYAIQTPVFPPYNSMRGVESRLDLNDGESGYLKTQVDNVYVADPTYTNLTDYWYATTSNPWSDPAGCLDGGGDGSPDYVQLIQDSIEVDFIDPDGDPIYGLISGSTLLFQEFEADGEFTAIELTLTDGSNGSGAVTMREDDGCMHGFDVDLRRATPGTIQFSAATASVSEDGATATVTVQRTGGSEGAVSVDYASSDGSATAGSDYSAASGTLNWADGDSADKTFAIAITDDSEDEADETIDLTLSGLTGMASLGQPSTATLTITDNDGDGSGDGDGGGGGGSGGCFISNLTP